MPTIRKHSHHYPFVSPLIALYGNEEGKTAKTTKGDCEDVKVAIMAVVNRNETKQRTVMESMMTIMLN